jgi:adenylylsulfate kinase-like enzyme
VNDRVPVLWLCGPPGVGKSTVSWQLFTELAATGVRVAFADTDQYCMCYPAPPGDPDRQSVKALNVGSVVSNFSAAGAQCLIVNGVLGAEGLQAELLPQADVTICRLRGRGDEIDQRFIARVGNADNIDDLLKQARDESRLMDQSTFADAVVDTTGRPAAEVAAAVRAACKDWPGFSGDLPSVNGHVPSSGVHSSADGRSDQDLGSAGGQVLLITGPTGVGKSTIGFPCYLSCLGAGMTAGYLDLDQLAFRRPADPSDPGSHRLKARNLAAIWRNYQAAGATHLVAVGPMSTAADVSIYAEALAGSSVTLARLRAESDELRLRVASRGAGGSWPQPGDLLAGQPPEFLAAVADQAVGESLALDRSGLGAVVIDTTGRTVAESAGLLSRAVGWPA